MAKKVRNQPLSDDSLNMIAREYCNQQAHRVHKNRKDDDLHNNSPFGYNIPTVVAACTSNKSPYLVCRGRNDHSPMSPHPILRAAYPKRVQYGLLPRTKKTRFYPVGHCAEPHAANRLLYEMSYKGKHLLIRDLRFSFAYSVKNSAVVEYCGTCKLTFPQLK